MVEVIRADSWDEMRRTFRWNIPARYNLAEDLCEKWARTEPDRLALIHLDDNWRETRYSFRHLSRLSNQLANVMAAGGVRRGDRVGVLLAQSPEVVLTHLAAHKLGAVTVPLFTLFGAEGLSYRLSDSGARMVITDAANLPKVQEIRGDLPDLLSVYSIDGAGEDAEDFYADLARARDDFAMVDTSPDDPALISYTSGTTGPPKGVLHGHRVSLGHAPGIHLPFEFFPQPGDISWTPADWAWLGGLGNTMIPALRNGAPLVAHRMTKFDPERAFDVISRLGVTVSFAPPTALKLLRQAVNDGTRRETPLRVVASGGEALGAELLDWGRSALGLTINEFYGQTECNVVLGGCASVMEILPGWIGKAVPGHEVAVIDSEGRSLPPGEVGEIAIRRPDPNMFLRYWNKPEKTEERFSGDWMRTGDEGEMIEEGYFRFSARTDDVITSSGYRVGPSEIEDCLTGHPAVAMAGVIGVPDPMRTEIVKAVVVLNAGEAPDPDLTANIIDHVRTRLSPHVAPRILEYADSLPMTATGKIMRRELRRDASSDG